MPAAGRKSSSALIAGYSIKTIWKAESGGQLNRQTLTDIAEALGVNLTEIVAGPESLLPTRREAAHQQRVLEMLDAYQAQEIDRLLDLVHDDAVFVSAAPPGTPGSGTFHGRRGVRDFASQSIAWYRAQPLQIESKLSLAAGDFVDWHHEGTFQSVNTGKSITVPCCFHFQFKAGRLIRWQEYQDYSGVMAFFDENGWPNWRR